ncbi:hypothetical protein [Streptomyces sp. NPDC005141]
MGTSRLGVRRQLNGPRRYDGGPALGATTAEETTARRRPDRPGNDDGRIGVGTTTVGGPRHDGGRVALGAKAAE